MQSETKLISPTTICTRSGRLIDLLAPDSSQITLHDMAHALGAICRYNGHTPQHYSVAEHSIWVSYALPMELRLHGLLHDAHEAYLGDITSPVNHALECVVDGTDPVWELKGWLDCAIYESLGLPELRHVDPDNSPAPNPIKQAVHAADLAVGAAECMAFGIPVTPGREQSAWDWQAAGFKAFPAFQSREAAALGWLRAVEQALAQSKKGETT